MLIFSVSFQFFRMSPRRGQHHVVTDGCHNKDFVFCLVHRVERVIYIFRNRRHQQESANPIPV